MLNSAITMIIATDRSSGVITLDDDTRLRPDNFVNLSGVAELNARNNATDETGIRVGISNVDIDGIIDHRIINSAGTELLYGLP